MPLDRLLYVFGEVQLAAADGVGPASAHEAPEALSGMLGANVQLTPLPETVQAGLNVGAAVLTVKVAVADAELPAASTALRVNV